MKAGDIVLEARKKERREAGKKEKYGSRKEGIVWEQERRKSVEAGK